MGSSHYDVLGVPAGASAAQIRAAYRRRAAEVHPDRWIDAGPTDRARAEQDMRAVSEAWHVLGDAHRRSAYDRTLGLASEDPRARAFRIDQSRSNGAAHHDEDLDDGAPLDGAARVVRALPWIAVFAVLIVIFVFTAYALTSAPKTSTRSVGDCVTVDGASEEITTVACDAAGARRIAAVVDPTQPCPTATQSVVPASGASKLCLEDR